LTSFSRAEDNGFLAPVSSGGEKPSIVGGTPPSSIPIYIVSGAGGL
jgi:hypothetical protein